MAEASNCTFGYDGTSDHMRVMRQMFLANTSTWKSVDLENSLGRPGSSAASTKDRIRAVDRVLGTWSDTLGRQSGAGMAGTMTTHSAQNMFPRLLQHLDGPAYTFVDLGCGDGRQLVRAVCSYGALEARGVDVHPVSGLGERVPSLVRLLASQVNCPSLPQRVQFSFGDDADMSLQPPSFFRSVNFPEAPTVVLMYCEGVVDTVVEKTLRSIQKCEEVELVAMTALKASGCMFSPNRIVHDMRNSLPSFRQVDVIKTCQAGGGQVKQLYVFKRLPGRDGPMLSSLGFEACNDWLEKDWMKALLHTAGHVDCLLHARGEGDACSSGLGTSDGREAMARFYQESPLAICLLRSSRKAPQTMSDTELRAWASRRLEDTTAFTDLDLRVWAILNKRDVILLSEGEQMRLTLYPCTEGPMEPSELPQSQRWRLSRLPNLWSDGLTTWLDSPDLPQLEPRPRTVVLSMDTAKRFKICKPTTSEYQPSMQRPQVLPRFTPRHLPARNQHRLVAAIGREHFPPSSTTSDGNCGPLSVLQAYYRQQGNSPQEAEEMAEAEMPNLRRAVAELLRRQGVMDGMFVIEHDVDADGKLRASASVPISSGTEVVEITSKDHLADLLALPASKGEECVTSTSSVVVSLPVPFFTILTKMHYFCRWLLVRANWSQSNGHGAEHAYCRHRQRRPVLHEDLSGKRKRPWRRR